MWNMEVSSTSNANRVSLETMANLKKSSPEVPFSTVDGTTEVSSSATFDKNGNMVLMPQSSTCPFKTLELNESGKFSMKFSAYDEARAKDPGSNFLAIATHTTVRHLELILKSLDNPSDKVTKAMGGLDKIDEAKIQIKKMIKDLGGKETIDLSKNIDSMPDKKRLNEIKEELKQNGVNPDQPIRLSTYSPENKGQSSMIEYTAMNGNSMRMMYDNKTVGNSEYSSVVETT
jgi:hypothetical protein